MHPVMNESSSFRVDQAGVICKQEGIFRVNCMDCLDRTNVVQAAIARVVMEQQVRSDQAKKHRFHNICYYVCYTLCVAF